MRKLVMVGVLALGLIAVGSTAQAQGWGIDPNGLNAMGACEVGGVMDPNGCPARKAAYATSSSGAATSTASQGDEGSQMDPNGARHASLGGLFDDVFSFFSGLFG